MKKAIKILITAVAIILTLTMRVMAESPAEANAASAAAEYEISQIEGAYQLKSKESVTEYESLSECMAELQSPAHVIMTALECEEKFAFPEGSYKISGSLATEGVIYIGAGADVSFSDLSLSLGQTSCIKIRGGSLSIDSSQIQAKGKVLEMDYSSSSRLEIKSGVISGSHKDAVISIENGTADISGGDISNNLGAAIRNDSELNLSGTPKISGITYDIVLESPMSLGADENEYFSTTPIRIQYMSVFEVGTLTEIFYRATERSAGCITLYDKDGKEEPLTHFERTSHSTEQSFAGVYLPHKIRFYVGDELVAEQSLLSGEKITLPTAEEQLGYVFDNWYKDKEGGEVYSQSAPVYSSFSLYGIYKLEPPKFNISSLELTYDGEQHPLRFDSLTHPIEGGYYAYTWYKNGEKISALSELSVSCYADSGIYSCLVTYTVNGKTAQIYAENIKVNIRKQEIPIPSIAPVEYTGNPIYPTLPQSPLYELSYNSEENVGSYPLTLTLTDSDNYCWCGSESAVITVYFEITKAKNAWTQELTSRDSYVGFPLSQRASARFGEVIFRYSATEDGTYTVEAPKSVGRYFVVATVAESENYTSLTSPPVAFSILPEQVVGLRVAANPDKTEYKAFELFDTGGMEIYAIYDSGREELISNSRLTVVYNDKKCLRVGDTGIVVEYLEASAHIPLTIAPIPYDLSSFTLPDERITYDGNYHTSAVSPVYLVGLDGIPLICEIRGGGSDAGSYTITAAFSTESRDYILPQPLCATLTIEPKTVFLEWSGSEFIYDGGAKLPEASFLDVMGAYRKVCVCGSAVSAGENYVASAVPYSENYVFSNPTFAFIIKKADYDTTAVYWSASSFTYTGEPQEVSLENLPQGISVVGYTDNRAVSVGKYSASAAISYDDKNYNPPSIPSHSWEVLPARYDTSGFSFAASEYEYDGYEHFPRLEGELPVGADGIPLTYTFSQGAKNVSDGEVAVLITFSTESKNYIAPEPVLVNVKILPKGIYVLWIADSFVYNGKVQAPRAEAAQSLITVSGGGANAGSYIARAESQDSNYTVINSTHSYEIKKAENHWLIELSAEDFYKSQSPSPRATAYFGTAEFRYFSDSALTEEISTFTPGLCYVVAAVPESENYLPLISSPVAVNCIEVVPISLRAEITEPLIAFTSITESIVLYLVYNDGAELPIPSADIAVNYQSGDSLRCSHTSCTVSYGGIEAQISVSVANATYDTSDVYWQGADIVYDGDAHAPTLMGLPSGVSIKEYIGAPATAAGEYLFSAVLSYDEENYNPPQIPDCVLKIRKATVPTLGDISLVYSGAAFAPPTSELYSYTCEKEIKSSGEYFVVYHLLDSENYVFENGENTFTIKVNVSPRELFVFISDYKLYLFEREIAPEYTVEGEIADGDILNLSFFEEGGRIYAKTDNPNYSLNVESGALEKIPYPGKEMREKILLCVIFISLLLSAAIIFVKKRGDILDAIYMLRARRKNKAGVGYIDNAPKAAPPVDVTAIINIDIEPEIIVRSELSAANPPELKSSIKVTNVLAAPELSESDVGKTDYNTEKNILRSIAESEKNAENQTPDIEDALEANEQESDIEYTPEVEELPIESIEESKNQEHLIEKEDEEIGFEEEYAESSSSHEESPSAPFSDNTDIDNTEAAEEDTEDGKEAELESTAKIQTEAPKIEVKMEYADSMITDTMARRMIKNEREVVYTGGRSRHIINVDTLSRNFMADDRVDVNILKKKSLVPYDTNYIKVLARGAIDKPLHVFANEFSLSAVKMILLSGGEAIRVISEKADKKQK